MSASATELIGNGQLLALTAGIVSAHVSTNVVDAGSVPELIRTIYQSLASLGAPPESMEDEKLTPAVPVKRSVFPDYSVCLEDGKRLKMLKRHLGSAYGMTPGQYRERWGLPADYPMVAPNYATRRSKLARANDLGRKTGAETSGAHSGPAKGAPTEDGVRLSPNDTPHITVLPERKRGRRKAMAEAARPWICGTAGALVSPGSSRPILYASTSI